MPTFIPSSYGGDRGARALREENPCHEPAGKPTGGQFAQKGVCGGSGPAQSTGEKHQQVLFSPDQMAKFHQQPQPGFGVDALKTKGDAPDPNPNYHLDGFSDESDNAEDILSDWGVQQSAREIATALVSQVQGETFTVTVSTSGAGESSSDNDGPDPYDVRGTYDEWAMEQVSEAESNMYAESRRDYLRNSPDAIAEINQHINAQIEMQAGETDRFLKDSTEVWDTPEELTTQEQQQAATHSQELALSIYKNTEAMTGEGYAARASALTVVVGDTVRQYLADNPDARFIRMPESDSEPGGDWADEDLRLEVSKYYNDDDGQGNWFDDELGSGAGDNVDSFDTWYQNEYGHSPDDYGESSGGDYSDASVEFQFVGSNDTLITRTVSMTDGELHVHHDYFKAGTTGEGVAKQLYQGSLPMYDAMGVKSLSTRANIDVGAYTWARYGFEADNARRTAYEMEVHAQGLFAPGSGIGKDLFTAEEYTRLLSLMDRDDARAVWNVADAKFYTTPEKAMAFAARAARSGTKDSAATYNKKLREEAAKGVVSVGRVLMARGDLGWDATLDLSDEAQVARLEAYTGAWRKPRQTGKKMAPGAPKAASAPAAAPKTPAPATTFADNWRRTADVVTLVRKMSQQRMSSAQPKRGTPIGKANQQRRGPTAQDVQIARNLKALNKRMRTTTDPATRARKLDQQRTQEPPTPPSMTDKRGSATRPIPLFPPWKVKKRAASIARSMKPRNS